MAPRGVTPARGFVFGSQFATKQYRGAGTANAAFVSLSVGQMDQATQSSAANSEQGASAEQLGSQGEQMNSIVKELIKLVE